MKILPTLLWVPVEMRLGLRRATEAFEDELLRSGLEPTTSRQIASTFNEAHKQLVKQLTSPQTWASNPTHSRHNDP
jgi:hypothetical protein